MLSVILYRTSFEYSILLVRTPRITDSILRPAWGDATLSHKVAYKFKLLCSSDYLVNSSFYQCTDFYKINDSDTNTCILLKCHCMRVSVTFWLAINDRPHRFPLFESFTLSGCPALLSIVQHWISCCSALLSVT